MGQRGQRAQALGAVGQTPVVTGHRLAGDPVQADRADVVAERVPEPAHLAHPRGGEAVDRRVALEELMVLRNHPLHLRLLQHDLGDEHPVRVARAAPGKIAAVLRVPREQTPLEAAARPVVRRQHGAQSSTSEYNTRVASRLLLHDLHAAAGATFAAPCGAELPLHYGDAAAEYASARQGVGLIDRSAAGVLEVTGRDRAAFLHAMLSNDIKALSAGRGCAAAFLDVHGKVEVLLFVWTLEDRILLVTPPAAAEKAMQDLDKYLFSEKASFRRRRRRHQRSEEHTSELQSLAYLVCRLLLEKKKKQ